MIERIKFFFADHPFVYNPEDGAGIAMESYNIFTDIVTVRHSLRGYVTQHSKWPRKEYNSTMSHEKWMPQK